MEEVIVGVVGTLQFDVLEYRLRSEYNVELYKEGLPFEYLRWIVKEDEDAPPLKEEDLLLPNDAKLVEDYKGNQLLLFASQWSIQWVQDRNKGPSAGRVRRRKILKTSNQRLRGSSLPRSRCSFIQAWSSSAGPSDGRPGLWPGSSLRRPGSAQRLWPGCSPPSPPRPPWQ